jgi:hypothetical protein
VFVGRDYFAGLRVTKRKKAMALLTLTLTLLQTPTLTPVLTLTLTLPYSKFVSKPILKKKVLTKCHSEVSEIVDAVFVCLIEQVKTLLGLTPTGKTGSLAGTVDGKAAKGCGK